MFPLNYFISVEFQPLPKLLTTVELVTLITAVIHTITDLVSSQTLVVCNTFQLLRLTLESYNNNMDTVTIYLI